MPLLRSRRFSFWKKAIALCDLTLPTMAALAVLYVGVIVLDVLYLAGLLSPPLAFVRPILVAFLGLSAFSLGVYAVSPFLVMRLPWRYALPICTFPLFLCWKLWISIGGRPDRWVRTPREAGGDRRDRLVESNSHLDGFVPPATG